MATPLKKLYAELKDIKARLDATNTALDLEDDLISAGKPTHTEWERLNDLRHTLETHMVEVEGLIRAARLAPGLRHSAALAAANID